MRVDKYGALENSADVTNLLFDLLSIDMETTGGDASFINVNNEQHNRSIHNMVRAGLIGINQHENEFCCAAEIPE